MKSARRIFSLFSCLLPVLAPMLLLVPAAPAAEVTGFRLDIANSTYQGRDPIAGKLQFRVTDAPPGTPILVQTVVSEMNGPPGKEGLGSPQPVTLAEQPGGPQPTALDLTLQAKCTKVLKQTADGQHELNLDTDLYTVLPSTKDGYYRVLVAITVRPDPRPRVWQFVMRVDRSDFRIVFQEANVVPVKAKVGDSITFTMRYQVQLPGWHQSYSPATAGVRETCSFSGAAETAPQTGRRQAEFGKPTANPMGAAAASTADDLQTQYTFKCLRPGLQKVHYRVVAGGSLRDAGYTEAALEGDHSVQVGGGTGPAIAVDSKKVTPQSAATGAAARKWLLAVEYRVMHAPPEGITVREHAVLQGPEPLDKSNEQRLTTVDGVATGLAQFEATPTKPGNYTWNLELTAPQCEAAKADVPFVNSSGPSWVLTKVEKPENVERMGYSVKWGDTSVTVRKLCGAVDAKVLNIAEGWRENTLSWSAPPGSLANGQDVQHTMGVSGDPWAELWGLFDPCTEGSPSRCQSPVPGANQPHQPSLKGHWLVNRAEDTIKIWITVKTNVGSLNYVYEPAGAAAIAPPGGGADTNPPAAAGATTPPPPAGNAGAVIPALLIPGIASRDGKLIFTHAMPLTQGQEIPAGTEITFINGQPIRGLTLEQIREIVRQGGAAMTLGLTRPDGLPIMLTLPTR